MLYMSPVWAREKSCTQGTCPPLPDMPAHKLNAVSGVGRRVQFQAKRFLPLVEMTEKPMGAELLRFKIFSIPHSALRIVTWCLTIFRDIDKNKLGLLISLDPKSKI